MIKHCVICKVKLTSENQTDEHILLNCLGGRISRSNLICHSCNNACGGAIDSELCRQIAPIRTMGGFLSGTGKNPPSYVFDKKAAVMHGDGTVKISPTIFTKTEGRTIQIQAEGEPEKISEIITSILKAKGKNQNEIETFLSSQEFILRSLAEPIKFSIHGPKILPSMFKQSLVLIAEVLGNNITLEAIFDKARSVVLNGIKSDHGTNWWRDSRPLMDAEQFERFGQFYNILRISSDEFGKVKGYFRLYNQLAYIFILTESDGPKNIDFFIVNDPSDTANFELSRDRCFNANFYAWLSKPVFDPVVIQENYKKFHERFCQRQYRHEIRHRISHVLKKATKEGVENSELASLVVKEFMPDIANASKKRNRMKMQEIFSKMEKE